VSGALPAEAWRPLVALGELEWLAGIRIAWGREAAALKALFPMPGGVIASVARGYGVTEAAVTRRLVDAGLGVLHVRCGGSLARLRVLLDAADVRWLRRAGVATRLGRGRTNRPRRA